MVYLSRITTKSGDNGTTSLGDGSRVVKDCARVEAMGAVDELNAVLGLLLASAGEIAERELIQSLSNDLFDLGADLCVPCDEKGSSHAGLRISESHVCRLESAIERLNSGLTPLSSFVLPGGCPPAAWCHLGRTVCRRAERNMVSLQQQEPINPVAIVFLNRLSDLLFVLARCFNQSVGGDILWSPGSSTSIPQ